MVSILHDLLLLHRYSYWLDNGWRGLLRYQCVVTWLAALDPFHRDHMYIINYLVYCGMEVYKPYTLNFWFRNYDSWLFIFLLAMLQCFVKHHDTWSFMHLPLYYPFPELTLYNRSIEEHVLCYQLYSLGKGTAFGPDNRGCTSYTIGFYFTFLVCCQSLQANSCTCMDMWIPWYYMHSHMAIYAP